MYHIHPRVICSVCMDSVSGIDHPLYRIRDPEFTKIGLECLLDRIKDIRTEYVDARIDIVDILER